jgi:hypothetical protein
MSLSVVIFPTSFGMLPVKLFHMKSLVKERFIEVSKLVLDNWTLDQKRKAVIMETNS